MLKQTLKEDIIKYMKNRDKIRLTALRTLMADVKNKEMDLKKDLTDDELIGIIEKTIKQLNETLVMQSKRAKKKLYLKQKLLSKCSQFICQSNLLTRKQRQLSLKLLQKMHLREIATWERL